MSGEVNRPTIIETIIFKMLPQCDIIARYRVAILHDGRVVACANVIINTVVNYRTVIAGNEISVIARLRVLLVPS